MQRAFWILSIFFLFISGCYESSGRKGSDIIEDEPHDLRSDEAIFDLPFEPGIDIPREVERECVPSAGITTSFDVAFSPPREPVSDSLACTVAGITGDMTGSFTIFLDCESGSTGVTLAVTTNGYAPLMLFEGQQVVFTYVIEQPWWSNEWFSITEPNGFGMIIGGINADSLHPRGNDFPELFHPLSLSEVSMGCSPEPSPEEPFCYQRIRTGVLVVYPPEGRSVMVPSGNRNLLALGDEISTSIYYINVGQAEFRVDFMCTDIPQNWFKVLITFFPGD